MIARLHFWFLLITLPALTYSQSSNSLQKLKVGEDVTITIDWPAKLLQKQTILIFYALPNGNTTEQTMGKAMAAGDDWHYDIQHIAAQTAFLRKTLKQNIVVAYLENNYKSWPQWKKLHTNYPAEIRHIVDTVFSILPGKHKSIYLNGHSGGGSFIFGYLQGLDKIPSYIKRISFLDSDYGYDSSYAPKLIDWLNHSRNNFLSVFAYNDSVALYNGKPLVSATGGTWYRSKLMLADLSTQTTFMHQETDSLLIYKSTNKRIQFFLKKNLDSGIYHTQQVELNGFIHSVLCGTPYDERGYKYYGKRAYGELIR